MEIIDRTPYLSYNGKISLLNKLMAILKFGYSWYSDNQSQKVVLDILEHGLKNGYTLLRNCYLSEINVTIPLILIGPAGIFVIRTINIKGNYRAKGESFLDFESKKPKNSGSNPIILTSMMALAVERYLNKEGFDIVKVEGILIAIDPGLFIHSLQPIVRVVMRDAIEHFVDSINDSRFVIEEGISKKILSILTEPPLIQNTEEFKNPLKSQFESPQLLGKTNLDSRLFNFNKEQWISMITLVLLEFIILLVLFWMIYINN